MKKQLFIVIIAIVTASGSLTAQQITETKAPNALTKETLLSLQAKIGLTHEQAAKAYFIFEDFYKADQKATEEMKASGTMTGEETQRSWENLSAGRDERLAVIFTEDQMKNWKRDRALSGRPSVSK